MFLISLTEVFAKVTKASQYSSGLCRVQTNLNPTANYNIAPLSKNMKSYSGYIKEDVNSISLLDKSKYMYCYFSADAVRLETVTETTSNETIGTAIKGTTIYEIGTSINASGMEATYYTNVQ